MEREYEEKIMEGKNQRKKLGLERRRCREITGVRAGKTEKKECARLSEKRGKRKREGIKTGREEENRTL